VRKTLSVLLALVICVTSVGCKPEVYKTIETAEQVVSAAQQILSTSNPEAGAILVQVGSGLSTLDALLHQYDQSVAAGKPGIATQIQAVANTITANLSTVLSVVKVKNPELIEYITTAVAIANSVINVVIANLPTTSTAPAMARADGTVGGALPTVPFKNHKDLKKIWNDKIGGAFPKAKV